MNIINDDEYAQELADFIEALSFDFSQGSLSDVDVLVLAMNAMSDFEKANNYKPSYDLRLRFYNEALSALHNLRSTIIRVNKNERG